MTAPPAYTKAHIFLEGGPHDGRKELSSGPVTPKVHTSTWDESPCPLKVQTYVLDWWQGLPGDMWLGYRYVGESF